MVNEVVLKYLKDHHAGHSVSDLKRVILKGGYSQEEFDEAIAVMDVEKGGSDKKNPIVEKKVVRDKVVKKEVAKKEVVGKNGEGKKKDTFDKSDFRWMRFAGILGIVFLVLGGLNYILSLVGVNIDSTNAAVDYSIFGAVIVLIILSYFYFYGFIDMGKMVGSKLLKISGIMNIVSVLLGLVLFFSLFFGIPFFVALSFGMKVFFVLTFLFIFISRVLFSIGLIMSRKYVRFSVVAGILGLIVSAFGVLFISFSAYFIVDVMGAFIFSVSFPWAVEALYWIGVGVPVLALIALLFEVLMLFDASKKFEK